MAAPEDRSAGSLEYILGLTAFTAGAVDIISFARLGGIFTSAMTGNLAFLGLYLASGALFAALGAAIALFGFVAGAAIGHRAVRGLARHAALARLLGGEVLLFAAVAVTWFAAPHRLGFVGTDAMIVMLAVAMGAQSIIGKQINLSNIPTVVFTSTLVNIVIGLTDALAGGHKFSVSRDTRRQLASFFLYLFGAFCAGFLAFRHVQAIIVLPLLTAAAAYACNAAAARP